MKFMPTLMVTPVLGVKNIEHEVVFCRFQLLSSYDVSL